MDVVHHLCNGVSFVVGTALHAAARAGVRLPGALPRSPWARSERSARVQEERS